MAMKWGEPSSSKQVIQTNASLDELHAKQIIMHLEPLDGLLRCHICFEYFNVCMMTKCSHNYCSLCIRKYMTYKAQCPICFQAASEPELRNNRQVDEILLIYRKIRDTSALIPQNSLNTSHFEKKNTDIKIQLPENRDTKDANFSLDLSACSDTQKLKSDQVATPRKVAVEIKSKQIEKVSCPVCCILIMPERINSHLDICLAGKAKKEPFDCIEVRRPLPKVVYHLLSDKDIKKKLKEYGLHTYGDRKLLIQRHKNFLTLYNSDCDSLTPRPVSEIISQIEREEIELKTGETSKKVFSCNKKSNPEIIDKEHEKYLKHNKKQFDVLIDDIRNRQRIKKKYIGASNWQENKVQEDRFQPSVNQLSVEIMNASKDSGDGSLYNNSPDLFDITEGADLNEDAMLCVNNNTQEDNESNKSQFQSKPIDASVSPISKLTKDFQDTST